MGAHDEVDVQFLAVLLDGLCSCERRQEDLDSEGEAGAAGGDAPVGDPVQGVGPEEVVHEAHHRVLDGTHQTADGVH